MLKNLIVLPNGTELYSGVGKTNNIRNATITQCVNSGTELTLGSTCAAMLECTIQAPNGGLSIAAGTEITLYKVDGDNRTKVGLFTLEKPTQSSAHIYKITAYDRVSWLDKNLGTWLEALDGWPYSMLTLAQMVCRECGLILATESIPNGSFQVQRFYGSDITGRKIMEWIGQLAGRFCRANADGEIEFAWYGDGAAHELAPAGDHYYFASALSYEDYVVPGIGALQIKRSTDDVGVIYPNTDAAKNVYVISGNFLAAGVADEILAAAAETVYKEVYRTTYTPFKVAAPASYGIEAGDSITLADSNGTIITSYVMTVTRKGQRLTLEATGSASRDSSTNVNNESVKSLEGKLLEITKDVNGISVNVKKIEADNEATRESVSNLEQTAEEISAGVEEVSKDLNGKIEENTNLIKQTAKETTSTIAKSTSKYDTGEYEISVYGYGSPSEAGLAPEDYAWDYYLDQSTGRLYQSVGGEWVDQEVEFPLITDQLSSRFAQTAEEINATVQDTRLGLAALAIQAENINASVKSANGDIAELQVAAAEVSSQVSNLEGDVSEIKQTAGQVSVEVKDDNGSVILSTYITADAWAALRTENGVITSGFYYDFELGRFCYKGSAEVHGDDGTTYAKIVNDRLVLYSSKDTDEPVEKLSIGFVTGRNPANTADVDYPYILLGNAAGGNVALIKKFWNGVWLGDSGPLNDWGNFEGKQGSAGFFVDVNNAKAYVVEGTVMKNVYTGDAIARFG